MLVSREEQRWRAEEDARTLVEAMKISSDPARLTKAIKAAKRMEKDQEERLKALQAVSTNKGVRVGKNEIKKKSKSRSSKKPKNSYNVFRRL